MLVPEMPTALQTLDLDATMQKITELIKLDNLRICREPASKLGASITLLLYIRKYM